ncbi:MAG: hypothetical protein ACK5KO_10005 [Arachnia sp.]
MAWRKTNQERQVGRELATETGTRLDVLAMAVGESDTLVATTTKLALKRDDSWRLWGWEHVLSGAWRGDTSTFVWRTVGGQDHTAKVEVARRLPEVFRERVVASTVTSATIDVSGGMVEIIGRRGLGGDTGITWYAVPSRGVNLDDPAVVTAVRECTDQLACELT